MDTVGWYELRCDQNYRYQPQLPHNQTQLSQKIAIVAIFLKKISIISIFQI